MLPDHVQRPPGGGDHHHLGCLLQQLRHHRVGVGDLLQVVQHHQQATLTQIGEQVRRDPGLRRCVHRLPDRGPHHLNRGDRRQRSEVHAVGKPGNRLVRDRDRQPGLARPTRAGQRHQPHPR